jgi:hypothetical protein
MMERHQRATWLVALLIFAGLGWMVFQIKAGGGRVLPLEMQGEETTILIRPARTVVALYGFALCLALCPPLYMGILLLPTRRSSSAVVVSRQETGRLSPHPSVLPRFYQPLFVVLLIAAAGVGGFITETLRTQLRLTASQVEYHTGRGNSTLRWEDVRGMVLTTQGTHQQIELEGRDKTLQIDLSNFAEQDCALLVMYVPERAHLVTRLRGSQERYIWRRRSAP